MLLVSSVQLANHMEKIDLSQSMFSRSVRGLICKNTTYIKKRYKKDKRARITHDDYQDCNLQFFCVQ